MSTGGVGQVPAGMGPSGMTAYTYSGISGNMNPSAFTGPSGIYGAATTGPVYCIQAAGGFSTTQQFDTIKRLSETIIGRYDVTGSVEVLMDVRLFNNKIGIKKDSNNLNLIGQTSYFYSDVSNSLITDSFTISASEFVYDLSMAGGAKSIVSVGLLSTIYSDFSNYVATYFAMPILPTASVGQPRNEYGFATLFSGEEGFNPNGGVFDASAFYNLVCGGNGGNPGTNQGVTPWGNDTSGASISTLSGAITVSNITQLLRNAVDANPFNNRNPTTGTTASDPYDRSNYGVTDGFLQNDLFFIPSNGFQVTLKLAIDQEAFGSPLNNVGTGFLSGTATSNGATAGANAYTSTLAAGTGYPAQDVSAVYDTSFSGASSGVNTTGQQQGGAATTTTFVSQTSSSTTLIQRVLQAPLLIRLANLTSDPNAATY